MVGVFIRKRCAIREYTMSQQSDTEPGLPAEQEPSGLASEEQNEEQLGQQALFRPLTRMERRNLWLKEYGKQDFALQMWVNLVEKQDLEIEIMLQMQGLLIFGVIVSTQRYSQFYIDLNEELHREREPETADALREYYVALVPPSDQPEIGPEGLPVIFRSIHMRDVTMMSAGQKVKMPYWRGKISEVDAFVIGATTE